MNPTILVVIPARHASTRLPGKPLLEIAGKPMIQHVHERARQARVDRVAVATDDERIRAAVAGFGGLAVMTSPDHPSGTDRVAEAARLLGGDIVVNVQGDEPLLHPEMIDQVVAPLLADPHLPMATLAHVLDDPREAASPDVVKVVCDSRGHALYFSRLAIPYDRDDPTGAPSRLRHIGLYAFRADFLQTYARLPPTPLERLEKLEQLRALENGYAIRVVTTSHHAIGVDTLEDLARVRGLLAAPA